MKTLISLLCLTLLSCATIHANPLETIEELDVVRYSGDWHQIAIIPNKFQKMCYANTMASYKVLPPNRKGTSYIEVTNSCIENNGEFNSVVGKARINPKFDSTAKLQVTFAKIFGKYLWFASGNYWILDIGDDYEYVVIGEPKREFGWILARNISLPKKKLLEIKGLLKSQGYNPCDLIMSRNNKIDSERLPSLCDYVD